MVVYNNVLAGAAGSGGADAGYKIDRSLRFNSADSAYLNRTPSSAGNRRKWTWSGWVKRSALGSQKLFIAGSSGTEGGIQFHSGASNMAIRFYDYQSGAHTIQLDTNALFRDPSAWMHIVGAIDTTQATASDRAKLYINGEQVTSFATATYPTQNLDTLVNNNTAHYLGWVSPSGNHFDGYLAEVNFIDGQALAPTDFGEFDADTGVWNPIKYTGTYGTNGFHLDFSDNSSNAALGTDSSGNNNTWTVNNLIAQGADGDAFTVLGVQTNSGNSNSVNVSSLSTISGTAASSWPGDSNTYNNMTLDFGTAGTYNVHADPFLSDPSADIYVYKSNDGSSWIALSKGQSPYNFTGRYIQWARTGSGYGGQTFRSPSTYEDQDSLLDSPTNYVAASGNNGGNYCTLNALESALSGLNNGNLNSGASGASSWKICTSTMAVSSGKWYWEGFTDTTADANNGWQFGFCQVGPSSLTTPYGSGKWSHQGSDVFYQGSSSGLGSSSLAYDLVAYALDMDTGTCKLYRNNSLIHTFTGITGTITPFVGSYGPPTVTVNFGQRPFKYTPPTGYKSLCTQNLPTPTIADGSTAFDVALYTGTGNDNLAVTGLNFQPDFVWLKCRSNSSNHALYDAVRGAGKQLESQSTNAEADYPNSLKSFTTDGFTVGTDGINNTNGRTYVGWAWDGGDLAANSAYNQSRVWSNESASYTGAIYSNPPNSNGVLQKTNLFDGNLTSHCGPYNTGTMTVPFGTTFSGTKTWRVLWQPWANGETIEDQSGNTLYTTSSVSSGSKQYYSFTGTDVSGLKFTANGHANSSNVYAIEVDGKILVDAGLVPVGSLNSSAYNQDQNWGPGSTVTGSWAFSDTVAAAFDGDLTTKSRAAANQATTIDLPADVPFTSSVKLTGSVDNAGGQIYIKDGTNAFVNVSTGFNASSTVNTVDITSLLTSPIKEIKLDSVGGGYARMAGIEVDGKILASSSVTPPSVPSIASSVRASQTAGFSISTYTGNGSANQTLGHNLGAAPAFVLIKDRTSSQNWAVLHTSAGTLGTLDGGTNYKLLELSSTAAARDASYNTIWHPTSTTVKIGEGASSAHWTNKSGDDYLMLAWAPVPGFSHFTSFEGTGSADPVYVHCGFRPRWILKKNADDTKNWYIHDTARSPFNAVDKELMAHSNGAEGTHVALDILSNGFAMRTSNAQHNASGNTYIVAAFAENPFKIARAR